MREVNDINNLLGLFRSKALQRPRHATRRCVVAVTEARCQNEYHLRDQLAFMPEQANGKSHFRHRRGRRFRITLNTTLIRINETTGK